MLLIIVATGNHFLFDAVAGGLVVAAGWFVASRLAAPAAGPVPHLPPGCAGAACRTQRHLDAAFLPEPRPGSLSQPHPKARKDPHACHP